MGCETRSHRELNNDNPYTIPLRPRSHHGCGSVAALNAKDLKALMNTLPVPKPRPTRKADMARAVAGYLHGSSLRRTWETLGERAVE